MSVDETPVRIAVFGTKPYDREFLTAANRTHRHELVFLEPRLDPETAPLADGFAAVCAFVSDRLDADVLALLAKGGTRLVALRSAGFNHVDLEAARDLGLTVARVPAYSPNAVAEHALGLILALDRKLHRAYVRVREGNFALDGLLGFGLSGKTVGIVGTGKIGTVFGRIMTGIGCRLLAHDPSPSEELRDMGADFVGLDELFAGSDIISLHAPLTPATHHMIDADAIARMRDGVVLVNTSRGALIDSQAVIDGLKRGKIGALGLDVYEEEEGLFFEDLSGQAIQDDVFVRLMTFPNVLITAHQAFFTREALENIAETTLANVTAFERGVGSLHEVTVEVVVPAKDSRP